MAANKATPEELVKRLRDEAEWYTGIPLAPDDIDQKETHDLFVEAADLIESLVQKKGDTSGTAGLEGGAVTGTIRTITVDEYAEWFANMKADRDALVAILCHVLNTLPDGEWSELKEQINMTLKEHGPPWTATGTSAATKNETNKPHAH